MDLNVNNYKKHELIDILEIEEPTHENIEKKTNIYIDKFSKENNIDYAQFFVDVKNKLLEEYSSSSDSDDSSHDENEIQYENLELTNNLDRTNNTIVINKDHNIIDKNMLDIGETTRIPIKQGILNPNLKNVINKILNIDSFYRQNSIEPNFINQTSNFTVDLTEPLNNVLKFGVNSVQIPFTWYNFDSAYGTNYLIIDNTKYILKSGFYKDVNILLQELNTTINNTTLTFYYDNISQKVYMKSSGSLLSVQFYDKNTLNSGHINHNLGWLLGFRRMEISVQTDDVYADCVPDLYGTKYILLLINDFNQNHLNNTVVNSIDSGETKLKRPTYFNRDLSYNISDDGLFQIQPDQDNNITQSQLYAFNQINENLFNNNSFEKLGGIVATDIVGLIPIKHAGFEYGDVYVEAGGAFQNNERNYFGPVNISRVAVKLIDDKGYTLNLNGSDWSFSLSCDLLYQY
jgi:hypothetical protein